MKPLLGQIMLFGGPFAPDGWAFCDGQLLPIADHEPLFALLGTTYGGDGTLRFALPDLRGRLAMHAGQGAGLHPRSIGQQMGAEMVTLAPTQLPVHGHDMPVHALPSDNGRSPLFPPTVPGIPHRTCDSASSAVTQTTGGGASHENMQPTLCLNFIIALHGRFPSRN